MINWIGIDRAIDFIYRNSGFKDLDEANLITWIGEAMQATEVKNTLDERVCFVEVEDKRAPIPPGTQYIVQVARNNLWKPEWKHEPVCGYGSAYMKDIKVDNNLLCPSVVEPTVLPEGCCETPQVDCNGCLIAPTDKIWYRPFFDQWYLAGEWIGSDYYRNAYTPVTLANHTFFKSLVLPEGDLGYTSDEYTVMGSDLLFNFEKGSVAIAYLRTQLDDKMRPMVPDRIEFFQACRSYVAYVMANIKYETDPRAENYNFLQKKEDDWQWYCGQARTWAWKVKSMDQQQNISMINNNLLPSNQYFGMFGNLAKPDITRYGVNGSVKPM